MTTNAMIAVFDLVITYGVDNPTAEQIAEHRRVLAKEGKRTKRAAGALRRASKD